MQVGAERSEARHDGAQAKKNGPEGPLLYAMTETSQAIMVFFSLPIAFFSSWRMRSAEMP
jgi:hypothetical protein